MIDQIIILIFLLILTGTTLFNYIWKAKKQVQYKGDERWILIQQKADYIANFTNYALIILLAIGEAVTLFTDKEIMLSLNRVLTLGVLYVGLHYTLEFIALRYYDNKL